MRMKKLLPAVAFAAAVGVTVSLADTGAANTANTANDRRVVVYYQSQSKDNSYISPKGLTDHDTGATDVIVGAIHLDKEGTKLNDVSHDDPKLDKLWSDLGEVHDKGVHVLGMVGGAGVGSFERLDKDFDTYYPRLKEVIDKHHLDGVDLDVEEKMSQEGIERLIDKLRSDYGDDFIITMAPVATALKGGGNLSGFDYDRLYKDKGSSINWFNTQFYCGWGSLQGTGDYEGVVNHGVVPASKVVAGTITNSGNCGSGYVPMDNLKKTVSSLSGKYKDFGGVAGWEYYNSDPGGTNSPWEWSANMSSAMGR